MKPPILTCGRFRFTLERPLIMGIVNLTPDSFSGDGHADNAAAAIAHAHAQLAAGADIIDIGAESTRPGAAAIPADEELARLLPVLRGLRDFPAPISVDTSKAEVMRAALAEGAALINDVAALTHPGALAAVAASDAAVCLMHMQGEPRVMQDNPVYHDVVAEVRAWLEARAAACVAAGIAASRIVIDPGFGFGKTRQHNFSLLRELNTFTRSGYPVLAGLSRKSLFAQLPGMSTPRPAPARLHASVAAALLAVERGAAIVRVHDVAPTCDALAVLAAVGGPD